MAPYKQIRSGARPTWCLARHQSTQMGWNIMLRTEDLLSAKKCLQLIAGFCLAIPLYAQASLFPKCDQVDATDDVKPGFENHIALKKRQPVYPRSGLKKLVEAIVILEFTVSDNGSVEDVKAIESGVTSGGASMKRAFERAAVRAASGFTYRPAANDGKPLATFGVQNLITFYLEGYEERLMFGPEFDKDTRAVQRHMRKRPGKAFKLLNERIATKSDALEKAAYLYLQAFAETQTGLTDKAIESLRASKALYDTSSRNPNAIKLKAYAGILLGNSYLKKVGALEKGSDSSRTLLLTVIQELRDALGAIKRAHMQPTERSTMAYVNLGLAAAQLQDWCISAASLAKGTELGERLGLVATHNWKAVGAKAHERWVEEGKPAGWSLTDE